jgi:hypothetical protein
VKRTSKLVSLIGCIAALSLAYSAPAMATEQDDGLQETQAGFDALGIAPEISQQLIDTLESGAPLESMKPGSAPVSTESFIQDGDTVTVKWYADGSPAVTAVQTPVEQPDGITPRSIQGCTYSGNPTTSYANGCTISGWWGTVQIGFLADYTLNSGATKDAIRSTYNGWQQCVYPTTCDRPSEIQARYQEGSSAAFSRWGSTVTSPVSSWEVWMQLNVGGDSAWSTSS